MAPFRLFAKSSADERLQSERDAMVQSQLARRGIEDERVLQAFRTVPRHRFIAPADPSYAYGDHPIPIACGQTVSQPYVVAYMLQMLQLRASNSVLEIGTGSGYQTALLAELVGAVSTIECHAELARQARRTLRELGYSNVDCRIGDGSIGWPDTDIAFDAIVGSAAARSIPAALTDQLAPGGRMILPVGDLQQELVLLHRRADGSMAEETRLLPVRFVPMRMS